MRMAMKRYFAFGLFLIIMMACLALPVIATAAAPALTFTPSVTSSNGSLSTRLTWATTPAATGCVASGHASWTGPKAASGAVDLPPITLSGTYTLTLSCTWAGDSAAALSWTAPTQNTDGTALTNLAGFRVYHGLTANALNELTQKPGAASLSHTFTGLAVGTHYFAVSAYNTAGAESALSAVGSKVITANVAQTETATLTVNPIPAAPSALTVN